MDEFLSILQICEMTLPSSHIYKGLILKVPSKEKNKFDDKGKLILTRLKYFYMLKYLKLRWNSQERQMIKKREKKNLPKNKNKEKKSSKANKVECYHCNGKWHIVSNCPSPTKDK